MAKKQPKSGSEKRRNRRGRRDRGGTGNEVSHAASVVGGFFGTIRRLIILTIFVLIGVVVYLEFTSESTTELDLRGRLGCSSEPGR